MPDFPRHDDAWYRLRLAPPRTRPLVVIDTDTANEIDDQFALAWALLSPSRLEIAAVYAAPFSFAHRRAQHPAAPVDAPPFCSPGEGMARSFDEIHTAFGKLGVPTAGRVFRGSSAYLASAAKPQASDAATHLITTARAQPADEPLYVVALGCVTNVASALLLAPDIVDRIVVVWTSGYPSHAPHVNDSFNLEQDLAASRLLLDSGVPHVYLPGFHVGAQLRLSLAEVERHVRGRGAMGDYLHHLFTHNPLWVLSGRSPGAEPHSWVIWDLVNIAWLLEPDWLPSELVRTPRLAADRRWQPDASRHLMREAYAVNRDAVFNDFFAKLARYADCAGPTIGA